MRSPSMLPDRPIGNREDDLLGRLDFARNIASLILNAPEGSTLRLGIYGSWGEGKTSVLQLIRTFLTDEGHVCAWIVPWIAETKDEISAQITRELARELKIDLTKYKSARKVAEIAEKVRGMADSDLRIQAADAVFGSAMESILGKRVEQAAETISAEIRKRLRGRRMIVFVDDLDRVRPDLVPGLLLTLREALDQPDYYYILALAPDVVERGLAAVHSAWGEPRQFLEKIVELPRYLPKATERGRRQYIDELLKVTGTMLSTEVLQALATYLPQNPRRIKLFIRYLASLSGTLERFGTDELDRSLFCLAQLLKTEFPQEVDLLREDDDAIKDIEYGFVRLNTWARHSDQTKQDQNEPRPEAKYIHDDHPDRDRFLTICEALRERGFSAFGRYGLSGILAMPDELPAVTMKEVVDLANQWLTENSTKEKIEHLHASIAQLVNEKPQGIQAIWNTLLEVRNNHLGAVVDMEFEADLLKGLKDASELMSLVHAIADGPLGFATGGLETKDWKKLFAHVAKWAHFVRYDAHEKLREREREVLAATFDSLKEAQKAEVYLNLRNPDDPEPVPGPEFVKLISELHEKAEQSAISLVIEKFKGPDALATAWGESGNNLLRAMLFEPKSPLYNDPRNIEQLRHVAADAANETQVQKNFLTFFRQLAYGAIEGGSFSVQDSRELLQNGELLQLIWEAAVKRPLNPRTAGSLRRHRATLGESLVSLDRMPVPEWWRQLEESGFFQRDRE